MIRTERLARLCGDHAAVQIGAPVFLAFNYVAYRTSCHAIADIATLVLLNVALDRMPRRRLAPNGRSSHILLESLEG